MLAGSTIVPPIPGVTLGHHDLSHHGKDPGKLAQLKIVEVETMKTLRDLLAKLKQTKEEGANLLDRTMVFLGSNLGDGSSHSVKNLPVLLAGGGFRHGQHLHFDPQNPPPLCNLYVSMLQRLGIEADKFSSSTGTLTGPGTGWLKGKATWSVQQAAYSWRSSRCRRPPCRPRSSGAAISRPATPNSGGEPPRTGSWS